MYFNKSERTCLNILLLIAAVSIVLGLQRTVQPEKGTTIHIINSRGWGCKVCRMSSPRIKQCDSSLTLDDQCHRNIEFDCPRPEDVFSVKIVRNIECTLNSCDRINQADFGSLGLLDFPRNFTWNIKAYPEHSFQISFTKTGIRQISPTDKCPDKHTYAVQAKTVLLGKYCLSGAITSVQILDQGSFSLDLPAGHPLRRGQFDVSVVEKITSTAKISVTFLNESSTTLLSPNYPDSFPNDDVMEWYFQVPNKHKAAIKILNQTQPTCAKKETAMEYRRGSSRQVVHPDEVQPEQNQGSFSLRLSNCQMDTRRFGSSGLSMNFTVSTLKTEDSRKVIFIVVTALLVIFIIVLLVVFIVIKKKKRELISEVSVYNPGDTNVQPGPSNLPASCEDDPHFYTTIDDSLVYSHLLKKQEDGSYDEYEWSNRPTICYGCGDDSTVSFTQPQQSRSLPNKPQSYIELMVQNNIYDSEPKNMEDRPPTPGPHLHFGGGN